MEMQENEPKPGLGNVILELIAYNQEHHEKADNLPTKILNEYNPAGELD